MNEPRINIKDYEWQENLKNDCNQDIIYWLFAQMAQSFLIHRLYSTSVLSLFLMLNGYFSIYYPPQAIN